MMRSRRIVILVVAVLVLMPFSVVLGQSLAKNKLAPLLEGVTIAGHTLHLKQKAPAETSVPQDYRMLENLDPTKKAWAFTFLAGLGVANPKPDAVLLVVAWQTVENSGAAFNPLATTQEMYPQPKDPCWNSLPSMVCGVKNYTSLEQGIEASVKTVRNGYYPTLLAFLTGQANEYNPQEFDTWGSGGSAVQTKLNDLLKSSQKSVRSNPIALGTSPTAPCDYNVYVALEANNRALRHVVVPPGSTFSFNQTMGSPDPIPYVTCYVPGGNWCNLAARYAQAARGLGLIPKFQDHGAGDLGGGPENSVAIWNTDGTAGTNGTKQDLEITNTTTSTVHFDVEEAGGKVTIVASTS